MHEFWDRISSYAPFSLEQCPEQLRPVMNFLSSAEVMMFGVPGFFQPRVPLPFFTSTDNPDALSFYDTQPLKDTLEELVDFEIINNHGVRLSLGAVNVRTGKSFYFDNQHTGIGPDHVRASGALPPGFPPVKINGEYYWDGGMVSNSPLVYVWDEKPLTTALIVQFDIFAVKGDLPRNIGEVFEMDKDIRYSSKARMNTDRIKEISEFRAALGRVLAKLPPTLADDPDVRKLAPFCDNREWTITRLINRGLSHSAQTKDYEFSRATVSELWDAGREDVRYAVANREWIQPVDLGPGLRVYDIKHKSIEKEVSA